MAELCDICVLPLVRMEEGGTRCNHCWEVTSRLKTFLGAPAARELVATTLAEIGCAPPACPACRVVVDDDGVAVRPYELWLCDPCVDGKGSECHTPGCALFLHAVDIPIMLAQVHRDEIVKHASDCPNQQGVQCLDGD